jgi:hypothetical protein
MIMFNVRVVVCSPQLNAQCSMLNAQCSMLNAQCSMLNAQCLLNRKVNEMKVCSLPAEYIVDKSTN